jgi:hypothetical protein
VYELQRLLALSKGVRYLTVKQVTQLNIGKRTARVGGITEMMLKGVDSIYKKIFTGHKYSVNGHIAVKGDKSVYALYDGDLLYWSTRN